MVVQERILNPRKKGEIHGDVFQLIYMQGKVALFDEAWDAPVFYGTAGQLTHILKSRGGLADIEFIGDKKLGAKTYGEVEITIHCYKADDEGMLKHLGTPLKGLPKDIVIPSR